jgi:hypothetical protein
VEKYFPDDPPWDGPGHREDVLGMIRGAMAKRRARSVRKAAKRTVEDLEATIDFLSKIEIEFLD